MQAEGSKTCRVDLDVWMRPNGGIYEYMALYVDTLLFVVRVQRLW